MIEKSLKDKTIKGVTWSGIDNVAQFAVSFIVGIVLVRLLSPSEYGLIGITTIFITVFNSIIDRGFSQAIIRKKEDNDDDYNTAELAISI